MISGLVKAQLVAFLTAKLVQSPLFNRGVGALHGTVTELSESAYSALERATMEQTPKLQARSTSKRTSTPSPPPPVVLEQRDIALKDYIERMRKDLEDRKKE